VLLALLALLALLVLLVLLALLALLALLVLNVQSLNDFYVFFAPQGSIPTSINILENNVTLIDAFVNFDVKFNMHAMARISGTYVLCLAISSPGASNTAPATKILTFVGQTFTPV
jgi:hypothetical protein